MHPVASLMSACRLLPAASRCHLTKTAVTAPLSSCATDKQLWTRTPHRRRQDISPNRTSLKLIRRLKSNTVLIEGQDNEVVLEDDNEWMERREADEKDRTRVISLETSLKYMDSPSYQQTYGDSKVWELYRRNFACSNLRKEIVWTRRKCIVFGKIGTGNPCPICRDEYLVVDHRNLKLISQFLTDYNRQLVPRETSGVCREQYFKLVVAIEKAKDLGLLDFDAPFVDYDYEKYKPQCC